MTDPRPVPPPPPKGPNYLLLGLLGVIVGLLVVVIVLMVSGGDETAATTQPTTTEVTTAVGTDSTVAATTSAAAFGTTVPAFAGDTEPKVAAGEPFGTFAFLAGVRFLQREGFTRVVFDFEGDTASWWSVEYAAGPFVSAADEPIPIAGTEFLRVVLSSTSFDLSGAEVRITYDGPERIEANTNSVVEIVRTDDFEGSSTWVIGVTGIKPFAVGTLTDPPRVFIDVAD